MYQSNNAVLGRGPWVGMGWYGHSQGGHKTIVRYTKTQVDSVVLPITKGAKSMVFFQTILYSTR